MYADLWEKYADYLEVLSLSLFLPLSSSLSFSLSLSPSLSSSLSLFLLMKRFLSYKMMAIETDDLLLQAHGDLAAAVAALKQVHPEPYTLHPAPYTLHSKS